MKKSLLNIIMMMVFRIRRIILSVLASFNGAHSLSCVFRSKASGKGGSEQGTFFEKGDIHQLSWGVALLMCVIVGIFGVGCDAPDSKGSRLNTEAAQSATEAQETATEAQETATKAAQSATEAAQSATEAQETADNSIPGGDRIYP
jgi:hypothetical protein